MAAKYFVWGEGVWREVDVASGRVSGWRRRARFVFLRRGRLLVARRRPVLRALDALAKGQPSAAADGRRLAHRSKSESRAHRRDTPAPPPARPACDHHRCCVHNGCHVNFVAVDGPISKGSGVATRCVTRATNDPRHCRCAGRREAATQSARDASTCTETYALSLKHEPPAPHALHVSALLGKHAQPTAPPDDATDKKHLPGPASTRGQIARRATADKTDSTSEDEPLQPRAKGGSYRQGPAVCKELIVSEADILALRGFVARTRPSALYRFDADDDYKRALFYAINPLVELERCARLDRLLSSRSAAALPHFAARLGLTPRRAAPKRYRERTDSSDTDKENKEKHSYLNKERSEPLGVTKQAPRATGRGDKPEKEAAMLKAPLTNGVANDAPRVKRPPAAALERSKKKAARDSEDSGVAASASDVPKSAPVSDVPKLAPASDVPKLAPASDVPRSAPVGSHVISKRASRANAKEYSNLEDHAIVAWVSSGARASHVGGNRVWRELQEQFERLTGHARSWHSLRNRYLRYILPALGALHLPPADVSRLRAAAATGAIKRQHRASGPLAARRASIHKSPPRGAASRLPRAPARARTPSEDDSDGPPSLKRRSRRVLPLDSTSKESSSKASTSNKDESSKAGGAKEHLPSGKAGGAKESAAKAGGAKEHLPSGKAGGAKESAAKAGGAKEHLPGGKAGGSKEPEQKAGSSAGGGKARSPRYSEVTRRFAARRRRAPSSSASPLPSRSPSPLLEPNTRSRRLFNPNAHV